MADVALAVTPALRTFPFQVPGGLVQQYTAVPKARLTFQALDTTIVAKGIGDTTSITITCTLPPNFAYTFEYCQIEIVCLTDISDADNFDDVGGLEFGFGDGLGGRRSGLISSGFTGAAANAGSVKVWEPSNPYTPPVYNQVGNSPGIFAFLNDVDAANTVEGDLSVVISVLQYDLAQVFDYSINFPLPVTAR